MLVVLIVAGCGCCGSLIHPRVRRSVGHAVVTWGASYFRTFYGAGIYPYTDDARYAAWLESNAQLDPSDARA